MSSIGLLGQVSRTVSDISVSEHWYKTVLAIPHLYTFGNLAFFDCQGTRLCLTQVEKVNPAESILYFQVEDVQSVFTELVKKGVEFIQEPQMIHKHEDGMEEWMAFFNDPDSRPLALMSQNS